MPMTNYSNLVEPTPQCCSEAAATPLTIAWCTEQGDQANPALNRVEFDSRCPLEVTPLSVHQLLAEQTKPDLLIYDLEEGFDHLADLLGQFRALPILAICDDKEQCMLAMQMGVADCLTKSECHGEELYACAHRALARHKAGWIAGGIHAELQYVLNEINYGIILLDSDLRLRLVNRLAMEIGRYTAEFIAGFPTIEEAMVFTRDRGGFDDGVCDHWNQFLEDQVSKLRSPIKRTEELELRDGRIFNYHTKPLPDGSRMLTYYDITELRQAQEALEFTQFSVDGAPIGIFWFDSQWRIIDVNNAATRQLGYSKSQLCHMSIHDIDPIHSQDPTHLHRRWQQLRAQGQATLESVHRTRHGSYLPVERTDRLLSFRGKEFLVSFATDITQRRSQQEQLKHNEQRYQALYYEADKSSRELMLLDKLQSAIANKVNLDELFSAALDSIDEIFEYRHAMIRVIEGQWGRPVAMHGYSSNQLIAKIEIDKGRTAQSGEAQLISRIDDDTDYQPAIEGALSALTVPIFNKTQVFGVLQIESVSNPLDENDLRILTRVADQISLAVENAKLHERTRSDLLRTEALYQISQAIQDAESIESLMQRIVASARQAIAARWVVIHRINARGDRIEHTVIDGDQEHPLEPLGHSELNNGLVGWVLKNRQAALTSKHDIEPRADPKMIKEIKAAKVGSTILLPLVRDNQPIGLLTAINGKDDPEFGQDDVNLMQAVANQSAAVMMEHDLRSQIEHQAFHDALTGLPNRILFENHLHLAQARADRSNTHFAVVFIDLDGFKHINDSLGHHMGDELLVQVTERLHQRTRESDTLARMGGDEFAVVLTQLEHRSDAFAIANEFLDLLKCEFKINNQRLFVGASVGVSYYPDDGTDSQTLLKHADSAMYDAKASGKNRVHGFTQELADRARERLQIESDLRRAVENGELLVYYQPQIDIATGRIVAAEALMRWHHPNNGWVSPAKFIPIAEDCGLIHNVGDWILRTACEDAAQWQVDGHSPIRVAVNISSLQLESAYFLPSVLSALRTANLPTSLLELELTEGVVMKDVDSIIKRLRQLREVGVKIAIDDFGTGYSSLRYLQKLPVDALKIDQYFISTLSEDDDSNTIVDTIILLAQKFSLATVAEGVQTPQQLQYLKNANCTMAQGFHLFEPIRAQEFSELLARTRAGPDDSSLIYSGHLASTG